MITNHHECRSVLNGKIAHGARIAARIGLADIRAKCPHFNGWIERLEALQGGSGIMVSHERQQEVIVNA